MYEIRWSLFADTSHRTGAKLSLAGLSARWHLIRQPAAATFSSGEGSHKSVVRNYKFLCKKFAVFLFADSSHRTGTKLNLAGLSARRHLIRQPAAATFSSGEGSHKSVVRNYKFLCKKFAVFLFADSSHRTGTKLNLAGLFARWHLIRQPAAATFPSGEGSGTCRTAKSEASPKSGKAAKMASEKPSPCPEKASLKASALSQASALYLCIRCLVFFTSRRGPRQRLPASACWKKRSRRSATSSFACAVRSM